MDPLTAFVIASLMMLLNGGVLGLMHRDLAASLRPSAVSWRISTLLVAAGCILLAVQQWAPPALLLPLANGLLMLGLTGYWHALRQFYGQPASAWLLLPSVLGVLGIWWYVQIDPDLRIRVLIASLVLCVSLFGAVATLWRVRGHDSAVSRRVLAVIFLVVGAFMFARGAWFLFNPRAASSVLDTSSWVNMISPLVAAILPVIGTTAFLLLCSERIRRQWELAASVDALTGLPNRRTLMGAGQSQLASGQLGAAALIDIDHFKAINDQYGHDVGDAVLRHVAECIARACPPTILAARLGGEEFALLLPPAPAAQHDQLVELVRQEVARHPFEAGPTTRVQPQISIGIAARQADRPEDLDTLLRRADQALYAAKAAGRNRVVRG